eukprot:2626797-Rhodomonas_salina.2
MPALSLSSMRYYSARCSLSKVMSDSDLVSVSASSQRPSWRGPTHRRRSLKVGGLSAEAARTVMLLQAEIDRKKQPFQRQFVPGMRFLVGDSGLYSTQMSQETDTAP